jgi:hypothetical protein
MRRTTSDKSSLAPLIITDQMKNKTMSTLKYWTGSIFLILVCTSNAQPSNPTKAKDRIEMQCGSHKVVITCGNAKPGDPLDERLCVRNTLNFVSSDGRTHSPKQPKNFRQEFEVEKTPTSIQCGQGKDGKFYVVVDFVAGPLACGPCSTMDIFSESGKRLTVNSKNLDRIIREQKIQSNKPIYIEEYGR